MMSRQVGHVLSASHTVLEAQSTGVASSTGRRQLTTPSPPPRLRGDLFHVRRVTMNFRVAPILGTSFLNSLLQQPAPRKTLGRQPRRRSKDTLQRTHQKTTPVHKFSHASSSSLPMLRAMTSL